MAYKNDGAQELKPAHVRGISVVYAVCVLGTLEGQSIGDGSIKIRLDCDASMDMDTAYALWLIHEDKIS